LDFGFFKDVGLFGFSRTLDLESFRQSYLTIQTYYPHRAVARAIMRVFDTSVFTNGIVKLRV
jgi:hypothetical protein